MDIIKKFSVYGVKRSFIYLFHEIWYRIYNQLIQGSYSQCGEDLALEKLIGHKHDGHYVDIGAYDPNRFSNTKRFYLHGWTGINIEPDPNNHSKFVLERPKDINLNIGIGKEHGTLEFYKFTPATLSTFSKEEAESYKDQGYSLEDTLMVDVSPLSKVLQENLRNIKIDFFSIDTEGLDLIVLQSNNWDLYRPSYICIESVKHTFDNSGVKANDVDTFLKSVGYTNVYDNGLNSIYKEN